MKSRRSPFALLVTAAVLSWPIVATSCSRPFHDCVTSGTCTPNHAGGAGGEDASSAGVGGSGGSGDQGNAGSGAGGIGANSGEGGTDNAGDDAGGNAGKSEGGKSGKGGGGTGGGHNEAGDGGEANASGSPSAGEAGDGPSPPDTEPPYVVSIFPETQTQNVRNDTGIVFTFNEPMDRPEAEKGFESEYIPSDSVTFSWAKGGRELTVQPIEPLEYGLVGLEEWGVSHRNRANLVYMTTIARDVAGNRLREEASSLFVMAYAVSSPLAPVEIRQVIRRHDGGDESEAGCPSGNMQLGDNEDGDGMGILLTFSTASLPFGDIQDLYWASLALGVAAESDLGRIHAYRVNVAPESATWDMAVLEDVASSKATNFKAFAQSGLSEDIRNRTLDRLTQYFVRFEDPTNSDDQAQGFSLPCEKLQLVLSYLEPEL